MKNLTVYNEKVQTYIAPPNRKHKEQRLDAIIDFVRETGAIFEQLFTDAKKRVLDEILYLSSGSGICKIGGERLAEKCNVSIRTVRAAVAEIKKTGEIVVARLANEHAGKYVFVDVGHADYEWIMRDVFNVNARQDARHIARLENSASLERVGSEGENEALNGLTLLSLRPATKNNKYINNNAPLEAESEKIKTYANQDAIALYERIVNDVTISDEIKDEAYNITLALSDAETIDSDLAIEHIRKINYDLKTHLRINKSVRATFKAAYTKALEYKDTQIARMQTQLKNRYTEQLNSMTYAMDLPF